MSRLMGLAMMVLALGLGSSLLVRTPDGRPGARAREGEVRAGSSIVALDALVRPVEGAGVLESPPEAPTRMPLASMENELEHAHWVEVRVVLPPHIPADERCFVVAQGRPFSDGSVHRLPVMVEGEGTFRVAFSPGAKAGWVGLESRYLYLQGRARWTLAKGLQTTTLAPRLGGRVTGRVKPPRGSRRTSLEGEIRLRGPGSGESGGYWQCSSAPLPPDGRFVFEQVPPGSQLVLEHRGASWLGSTPGFSLAPGTTEHVDLQLERGVVLSGTVRDASGACLPRALIRAGGLSTRSRSNGSFRFPALQAGAVLLTARCKGYVTLEQELGTLQPGSRRGNLALVLACDEQWSTTLRGNSRGPARATGDGGGAGR